MGDIVKFFQGLVLSKEFDSFSDNISIHHGQNGKAIMANESTSEPRTKSSRIASSTSNCSDVPGKHMKSVEKMGNSSDKEFVKDNILVASSHFNSESNQVEPLEDDGASCPTTSTIMTEQLDNQPNKKKELSRINTDGMTLLQMAEEFRTNRPDLWSEREVERLKRQDGSSTMLEKMESFLDSYYNQQHLLIKAKKEREIQESFAAPQVLLQLTYHSFPKSSFENDLKVYENLFENYGVFEKEHTEVLHFLPGLKQAHEKYNCEMHIAITKGKHLLNYLLEKGQNFDSCCIKCHFYPGHNNHERTEYTSNVYVTLKGKARWEHVFVLKDYTTKDLDISYVMLVVTGKKNDKSEVIGRTVLAGKYAKIWDDKVCEFRDPSECEVMHWEEAIKKPFTTVHATSELTRPIVHDTTGIVVSVTQAFSNIELRQ